MLRSSPQEQKMANVPDDRIEPAPPFTSSCCRLLRSLVHKKNGYHEVECYGILFTCIVSRAIHLEVANSLSTDSFFNTYRCFMGHRGPVRQIRSDQGTFCWCTEWATSGCLRIRTREVLKSICDWVHCKMNVPHASHMVGAWECQICTARNVLASPLTHNLMTRHSEPSW